MEAMVFSPRMDEMLQKWRNGDEIIMYDDEVIERAVWLGKGEENRTER